jgi:hypothetical protein
MVAVALLATELSMTTAWAHGVVGDYVFLEPIITQDPTPANELDILQPSWVKTRDANNYAVGFSVEKVLYVDDDYMPRFSVGGGSNWSHSSPYQGPSLQGFDDLTMFAKYAFYYSLKHEFLMSIAAQLQLPTGNTDVEAQSHTSLGPVFLWEKGLVISPIIRCLNTCVPSVFRAILAMCRRWEDKRAITCLPTLCWSTRSLT